MFRTITDVTAPKFHVGQQGLETVSCGQWIPAQIRRIAMWEGSDGRKRIYYWNYFVTVTSNGREVPILRVEHELRSVYSGETGTSAR